MKNSKITKNDSSQKRNSSIDGLIAVPPESTSLALTAGSLNLVASKSRSEVIDLTELFRLYSTANQASQSIFEKTKFRRIFLEVSEDSEDSQFLEIRDQGIIDPSVGARDCLYRLGRKKIFDAIHSNRKDRPPHLSIIITSHDPRPSRELLKLINAIGFEIRDGNDVSCTLIFTAGGGRNYRECLEVWHEVLTQTECACEDCRVRGKTAGLGCLLYFPMEIHRFSYLEQPRSHGAHLLVAATTNPKGDE